ncbi:MULTISPECIES: LytR/AlgR family response regulator transcription factor [Pseudothermotoga]|jgi:two-component system response regulator LytT|uniref:Two component transcriptional regulator, LytTR family n=1 Tax=Pseudothermotoga lettingae (strain ATCC BAA-301 / DSM 14385 / NBRC 107922 / TMO) TaxID=416591 RepID=A8F4Q4_PSELT|nr:MULTISPECIES: LytTR family DNA-binding domain-containing protein [Pseudothermotoga]ABV33138.1 two component transcriptional regulator, LytTR family [Pseudothermotoga lettingae TMO]KUK21629.1 MAG: Two component transcriptional regulator, LytTR family [Pseudothermotoga lettingae]MDI3494405.1 two-component system, LytTR family, response regulator LytT [Pseudothermotoga sp.]MDK2884144.1 two-component system, LytTR family, response regulator LytT [Pseudothermotoga sp.]GLI47860.1 DNA-binding resp
MIKVAILEDEQLARDNLEQLIRKYSEFELVGSFSTGRELLRHLKDIDVVFLDVRLSGESGLDVSKKIKSTGIVFVTAYPEYAVEAFEVNAIDYLVKPVSEERFSECVEKISQICSRSLAKLPVKDFDGILLIDFKDILFIEAFGKKCMACTINGEYEVYHWNISHLERRLPREFVRVHKSYICNLEHVKKILCSPCFQIEMENSKLIPVSKKYQKFVKSVLLR